MADPEWRFATVITASNARRDALNWDQACQLARERGVPVIAWARDITLYEVGASHGYRGPRIEDFDSTRLAALATTHRQTLFEYIVPGAPVMLTENIATLHGLANGTPARVHSVTTDNTDDTHRIASAAPGTVVVINAPASVNVQLEGAAAAGWGANPRLPGTGDAVVVPLQRSGQPNHVNIAERSSTFSSSVDVSTFPFELAFAVTYHRVQGRTLDRAVLDLEPRSIAPHLNLFMLFVGASRVRSRETLRRLPSATTSFDHLTRLTRAEDLAQWNAGYDDTGRWRLLGLAALATRFAARRRRSRAATPARPRAPMPRRDSPHPPRDESRPRGAGAGAGAGAGGSGGAGAFGQHAPVAHALFAAYSAFRVAAATYSDFSMWTIYGAYGMPGCRADITAVVGQATTAQWGSCTASTTSAPGPSPSPASAGSQPYDAISMPAAGPWKRCRGTTLTAPTSQISTRSTYCGRPRPQSSSALRWPSTSSSCRGRTWRPPLFTPLTMLTHAPLTRGSWPL